MLARRDGVGERPSTLPPSYACAIGGAALDVTSRPTGSPLVARRWLHPASSPLQRGSVYSRRDTVAKQQSVWIFHMKVDTIARSKTTKPLFLFFPKFFSSTFR
ncbi:hypothetical protein GWI33_002441 [Rhynchophorus ferrugineus]|uniref:Uncharacterized protein n=1 Tax=Rhynchophorus ferrugineus TaxID=354439 RepID=A0A834IV81_RHYFE|nr:hypothetical protein GWI33_002441 [Rhynchophorus ferrugineus]